MISILASSDFLPPPSPFVAKSRFDGRFSYSWKCKRSEDALYFHTYFWWWFQYLYALSYVFLVMISIFCNVRCSSYYNNISNSQKVTSFKSTLAWPRSTFFTSRKTNVSNSLINRKTIFKPSFAKILRSISVETEILDFEKQVLSWSFLNEKVLN